MKTKKNLLQIWLMCAAALQALTTGAQPVTKVAAGQYHSLFLKSDGSLWAMGKNNLGQLGSGDNNSTNRPIQILSSDVTAVAAGFNHSLLLKSDGSLWAMGLNSSGQLGDGSGPSASYVPEQIVASNVTAIAAGANHSLFLKSDGSLWAMGLNGSGQLGDGTSNESTNLPEQIVASNVTAITAGYFHSLFLKSDGSLWAMGDNGLGQLGDGTTNGTNRPKLIVGNNVTAIAAGQYHSLFLKNDGSLWAMGYNNFGQLGDGTINNGTYYTNRPEQIAASNVTAIAAGSSSDHSLYLSNNGSLWAMGRNSTGQLGDGTYTATNRPKQTVANGVTAIAGGSQHSLFVNSDGSLCAMGFNASGQLGDGTYNSTNHPQQIVAGTGYNQITWQFLSGGGVRLFFVGIAGRNYALDRSFSLVPTNWQPLATNPGCWCSPTSPTQPRTISGASGPCRSSPPVCYPERSQKRSTSRPEGRLVPIDPPNN